MKKLFTLVALLAMVLGASAQQGKWEEVYKIDYSTYTGFPFYVMGYVPEFDNGCMTDYGAAYRYATQDVLDNGDSNGNGKLADGESSVGTVKTAGGTEYQKVTGAGPYWHQYFAADGVPTVIDETYKVVALVKASEAVTINVNFQWGWGGGQQLPASVSIPQSDEFAEVEWEYSGIGGSSCALIAQPGTATATIEWKSITVYHKLKENQRPKVWLEALTNGDAEQAWPAWALEETNGINANWRGDRANEICAWALTMGRNYDDQDNLTTDSPRSRPFPADIEEEAGNASNHVFAVHVNEIKPIGDDEASIAWSNQFWIQSPQAWKEGTQIKLHFRYKADHACSVSTQIHKKNPSVYLHWQGIGDVNFTESWQEFDKTITFDASQAGGYSVAFNLASDATNGRTPNVFYFDDFSWQYLKLDEGYFVSGINAETTTSYDNLDNAIEFTKGDDGLLEAVVGEAGNAASYVSQVMISTTRGDDAAFKSATLKPNGKIQNDPDNWMDFTASSNAKLDLPGLGVWKVYLDLDYNSMAFEMLEGTPFEQAEPVEVVTNKTEVVVHGQERDDIKDDEHPDGTGAAWDNQFFFVANRVLKAGEVTHLKFSYKASKVATSSTQTHGTPGAYIHWAAIGNVNFTEEWQTFDQDFTVPKEADGSEGKQAQSIAFNLAEIKEACDYYITDVQWYLKDESLEEGMTYENLINAEGTKNFYVKEGAGTAPYEFGTGTGITNIEKNVTTSSAIYNIAGQRVSKDFKGLVVKDGKKMLNK